MICPACDAVNTDGSTFCVICGKGLEAVSYTHLTLPTNREV